ncbi:hypothetical protein EV360DRAFT_53031, partial [Lentinula raphanica]
ISSLTFRWIAIPWLQTELDQWVQQRNNSKPKRYKHKFLPHDRPFVIRTRPQDFNVLDFKVGIPLELIEELRSEYAPLDHEVFQLTPVPFDHAASSVYTQLGHPHIRFDSFWTVYRSLLAGIEAIAAGEITAAVDAHARTVARMNTYEDDINHMALLPDQCRRTLNDILVGGFHQVEGDKDGVPESAVVYTTFSSDDEELE